MQWFICSSIQAEGRWRRCVCVCGGGYVWLYICVCTWNMKVSYIKIWTRSIRDGHRFVLEWIRGLFRVASCVCSCGKCAEAKFWKFWQPKPKRLNDLGALTASSGHDVTCFSICRSWALCVCSVLFGKLKNSALLCVLHNAVKTRCAIRLKPNISLTRHRKKLLRLSVQTLWVFAFVLPGNFLRCVKSGKHVDSEPLCASKLAVTLTKV